LFHTYHLEEEKSAHYIIVSPLYNARNASDDKKLERRCQMYCVARQTKQCSIELNCQAYKLRTFSLLHKMTKMSTHHCPRNLQKSQWCLIFSERELMFMFAICRRPSVCLSVVCLSVCL